MSKTKPIFTLKDISYKYGNHTALDSINLNIYAGEKIAILGANGSGKSTLLKILDALNFPSSGIFNAFGKPVNQKLFANSQNEWDFRKQVGFVFQDPDVQLFCSTVTDEIKFGPLHLNLPMSEITTRTEKALATFDLFNLRNRAPYTLSGGEKKKVALASILSIAPRVWLFDEPTASLDPKTQSILIDFLNLQNAKGDTIITTTHDLVLLNEIADRVIVMSENHQIVADDEPDKIINNIKLLVRQNLVHEHYHNHDHKTHRHQHIHGSVNSHSDK
jgi:cobalt/nickel transport system ATP-binding protein